MRELYDKLLYAYKSGNEELFAASTRNWLTEEGENPFEENSPAYQLYFTALMYYKKWRAKVINYRNSKVQMIECAKKIAELNLPNPYPEEQHVVEPEPVHVLGVMPEAEPEIEPVAETQVEPQIEPQIEIDPEANIETEPVKEEKEDEKRTFFGKHKKK